MPTDPESAKPGLGTNIVQALAKQLDAQIQVADAKPGAKVSIVHARLAAVVDQVDERSAEAAV